MNNKAIGELNGKWALLLKATLICIPVLTTISLASFLPWSVWVTGNVYTACHTLTLVNRNSEDLKDIHSRIEQLPPKDWRDRIVVLENGLLQNNKDHVNILISLEQIKSKLQVKDNGN